MSKKNYEAIAATVRKQLSYCREGERDMIAVCCLARDLADYMANDNPRFQRDRFLAACGVAQ